MKSISNNSWQVISGRRRFYQSTVHALRMSTVAVTLTSFATVTALSTVPAAQAANSNYIKLTAANATHAKRVTLGLDKSVVVDLPVDAHDILVANPRVADAVTRTARRLYIFGKEIGQTNIFVFDRAGKQIAAIELNIERDISGLVSTIQRLVVNSDVDAEMINDNLVLTGTVSTPQDAAKAIELAEIFLKGGENTQQRNTNTTASIIFGQEDRVSSVVNLMKIDGEDQVHLKVTIAEVQRVIVKQLGINSAFSRLSGATGAPRFGLVSDSPFSFASASTVGGAFANITPGNNSLQTQLNAMEQAGVMRTLAEPSLTAISGEKAAFKVGGQYPVLNQVNGGGDDGIQLSFREREYGVALNFTPVVLTSGRINLKIRAEVSEPSVQDSQPQTFGGVNSRLPGTSIIGVRQRMADTTVELPSGGSMVIGGLIQDDVRQVISGLPGLAKIPIFGALFRSREFRRNETEVIVIVTPYLVRPVARKKLARPDENFQPASDGAGYFMGRINRVYGTKQGRLPKGRYQGTIGFIMK